MKHSIDEIKENPMAVKASQEREDVNDRNRTALAGLMREYGFTLPRNALDWRPTKRSKGNINGLKESVTVLCTDGVVSYFLDVEGGLFYGHNANFDGDIKPLHSVEKKSSSGTKEPREVRMKKPKTLSALEQAIALLRSL